MLDDSQQHKTMSDAYRRMMQRAATKLREAAGAVGPSLQELLHSAVEGAVALKELTREEAEQISYFVKRDLQDAAAHLKESGKELSDWLRFDIELVEDRVLEALAPLVDHTRVELDRLAMEAELRGWHTGEVTGPGTLFCDACGEALHFHNPGHIPPCPKCKATVFHRRPESNPEQ